MYINMIGNMHTHLKSMEMRNMWDLKKKSGDFTKGALNLDEWLKKNAEEAKERTSQKDEKLSEILAKYYAGKKLTSDERVYLRDHAPQIYKELVSLEEEQKAYERELRQCKTKEEVERLKMSKINGALVTVNSVSNNPNIPDNKKLEIMIQQKRRVDAIEESTRKFVESGEYGKLPTEAEVAKANREQMEELYQKPESEEVQKDETLTENENVQEDAALAENEGEENAAGQENSEVQKTVDGAVSAEAAGAKKADKARDPIPEKAEPEFDTPEERKVRRAKAKAAYAALQPDTPSAEKIAAGLDIKA